jgi:rSAM/selenodomain-associated transferase 1
VSTLLVIAKEPRPGFSKTRLCPPCTPDQAATLAAAALADTLRAVRSTPARRRVLALDGAAGPWLPDGFEVVPQGGGDLAERLAAAFDHADGPALLVGMDTPQATSRHLQVALAALADHDAVLGPAPDGGYWAIGLRRPDPRVFEGVPMSRPVTGALQLARLRELGLRTALLESVEDVDTFDTACRVAAASPGSAFAAALAQLDLAHAA